MYHNRSEYENDTSTPKRRRLGTGRIYRRSLEILHKNMSPKPASDVQTEQERQCESPLPCNQIEYLCSSSNNSSANSNFIIDSPGYIDGSGDITSKNFEDTFHTGQCEKDNHPGTSDNKKNKPQDLEDEDIFDDMFNSELVEDSNKKIDENHEIPNTIDFCSKIEDSFKEINQSINNLDDMLKSDVNLFETKDSFLLDIKETALFEEESKRRDNHADQESYYGLPLAVKSLFKTLRNIDKFYDWQEECLNLDTIKRRGNLIYALPTSGGKTLVAEVLMLREVLNRKHNALFILPFVAIVQEKIWSLSPFAVQLGFLLEEYAGGKGRLPPPRRRARRSIYIATIEKGLALVRSLIELGRLDEIGLVVVDELHLLGEEGRGATLETLLATVMLANQNIQIVGMSATIGNLPEVASFLSATVYERHFRPVELTEYVQLGSKLHRIVWKDGGMELEFARELNFDYSDAARRLDPDGLGGLVAELAPAGSCLVFCPTKKNCENVAELLCKMQRKEMSEHRSTERARLAAALRAEGAAAGLVRAAGRGVAWHHAGLAGDERAHVESGYRSGVISVLCCTSTLAAGVNLPARRVIVRAPRVGRQPLTLAAYRQMAGRAGRAGCCDAGESIIICAVREWPALRATLQGGVCAARSSLAAAGPGLLLSCVALKLANTRPGLRRAMEGTLLARQADSLNINIKQLVDDSIRSLIQGGALEVQPSDGQTDGQAETSVLVEGKCVVRDDTVLVVSRLGNASIKGCLELGQTRRLLAELDVAGRCLVLRGCHLLYLLTPYDGMQLRIDYRHYYKLYCDLDEDCARTAAALGLSERTAVRMMTGKPITNIPETVLQRFYLSLALYDLWNEVPFATVSDKYAIPRGSLQTLMSSASAASSSALRVTELLPELWGFQALLSSLAPALRHCAAPQLTPLLDLPHVRKARASQLYRAGFKRVEEIAKSSPEALSAAVPHLARAAAATLVSAARLMLIEKVENLKAEAEDVLDDLRA